MIWKAGDGSRAFHDLIRIPGLPDSGLRTNPFFVGYYRDIARDGAGLEAREHTAQVLQELLGPDSAMARNMPERWTIQSRSPIMPPPRCRPRARD